MHESNDEHDKHGTAARVGDWFVQAVWVAGVVVMVSCLTGVSLLSEDCRRRR